MLEPKACFTTIGEPSYDSHFLLGLEGKAGSEATPKHSRTEWLPLLTVTLKSLYQRDSEYPGFSSEHIVRGLSRFEPSPFSSIQPLSVLLHLCSHSSVTKLSIIPFSPPPSSECQNIPVSFKSLFGSSCHIQFHPRLGAGSAAYPHVT